MDYLIRWDNGIGLVVGCVDDMLAKVVRVFEKKFEDVDSCYYHHNMNNAPYCTHLRYYKLSFYVAPFSGYSQAMVRL